MRNPKEPIRLRRRLLGTGYTSLYLDIYREGRRRYEYLHLYLVPEKTRADKEKNRDTLQLAEAIRAKRVVEFRNGVYGFKDTSKSEVRFFDYYLALAEQKRRKESAGNCKTWKSFYRFLATYEPRKNITISMITKEWVAGFREFLDRQATTLMSSERKAAVPKPLSENTKSIYFSKLQTCLNQAVKDGIIASNPSYGTGFSKKESTRMYLTIDELKKLAGTDCENAQVKAAFLFSCLTGLRRSDVLRLTWDDVYRQGGFTRIIFKQKKTSGLEYLDITDEAAKLMGERGKPADSVFADIKTPSTTNSIIRRWVKRAGINKAITFHSARHTFATMMLDLGTDIYTVSKLLGHSEISTTQIYAKVLDKNKQAAVSKIPSVLTE